MKKMKKEKAHSFEISNLSLLNIIGLSLLLTSSYYFVEFSTIFTFCWARLYHFSFQLLYIATTLIFYHIRSGSRLRKPSVFGPLPSNKRTIDPRRRSTAYLFSKIDQKYKNKLAIILRNRILHVNFRLS